MKNLGLLFERNSDQLKRKYKIHNGWLIVELYEKEFTGKTIKKLISIVNGIHCSYGKIKIPIFFAFGNVRFADKLTYIVLECVMYYLMKNCGHDIKIKINPKIEIDVEGIGSSPLMLLSSNKSEKRKLFIQKFKFDIYMRHFRRVVQKDNIGILDELNYFLNPFNIEEENRESICEVISELISNGTEHAEGECLIDIDVTEVYNKMVNNQVISGDYYGINIVVLNLSNVLLGTQMKEKILYEQLATDRYRSVRTAYDYHKDFFDDRYMEEDFFNMSAFQHRISSRFNEEMTGGTGLTLLIKSLEKRSDDNLCYVLSGKRILCFFQKYLEYKNDWIGFNPENNFLTAIPDKNYIDSCDMFFPGTAYNLHFIMEKKDE